MQTVTIQIEETLQGGTVRVTERAAAIAALFGIDVSPGCAPRTLFPRCSVTLGPGDVVLITGPSGAGKSTLLRAIAAALRERGVKTMTLDELPLPADMPAVDAFDCPLAEALTLLARAGLSEAGLLVRAPAHFSEGQRFRYRLAHFFASDADVLVADEFCATLDRITARVVAWQLGKFARASGKSILVATTHEDLAADLRPTLQFYKPLEGALQQTRSK
jgi:ABC-type ATPase with predicted acetyltransferase domain